MDEEVVNEYLGKTGIYCNVFVANALRYAGSSTPEVICQSSTLTLQMADS